MIFTCTVYTRGKWGTAWLCSVDFGDKPKNVRLSRLFMNLLWYLWRNQEYIYHMPTVWKHHVIYTHFRNHTVHVTWARAWIKDISSLALGMDSVSQEVVNVRERFLNLFLSLPPPAFPSSPLLSLPSFLSLFPLYLLSPFSFFLLLSSLSYFL